MFSKIISILLTPFLILSIAFSPVLSQQCKPTGKLKEVLDRQVLSCGVNQGLAGFSVPGKNGWNGLDVDYCRAIASAIFGDPNKIKFVPLSAKDRFMALLSGEIDILSRNTTWTMARDTIQKLRFVGATYYDGQGLMVRAKYNINSPVEDLANASICAQSGTTTEINLTEFFTSAGKSVGNDGVSLSVFEKADEVTKAYMMGRCDALTADISALYTARATAIEKPETPEDHIILPIVISKEPLGPLVLQGDDMWFNVARWVYFGLLSLEEAGLTMANVDQKLASPPTNEIRRILGLEGNFGEGLCLDNKWLYNIAKHVGNYGEIFDRNLGKASGIGVERGMNALWSNGGLQYAPPIR